MLHNKRFARTHVVDLATHIFKGLFFSWAVHLIFAMVFWRHSLVFEMWWCLIIILIWTLLVPRNYKYSIWKTGPLELVSWTWWEMCLVFFFFWNLEKGNFATLKENSLWLWLNKHQERCLCFSKGRYCPYFYPQSFTFSLIFPFYSYVIYMCMYVYWVWHKRKCVICLSGSDLFHRIMISYRMVISHRMVIYSSTNLSFLIN